jgi:hypothetical protein
VCCGKGDGWMWIAGWELSLRFAYVALSRRTHKKKPDSNLAYYLALTAEAQACRRRHEMDSNPVETQRIIAVLEETLEKLSFLGR